MKQIICLGIESTAHTFGVGIINSKGKILANQRAMFTTTEGGIHPTLAKEHHIKNSDKVIKDALEEANLKLKDINLISFSQGPGLPPCLVVGMEKAKELSKKLDVPSRCKSLCMSFRDWQTKDWCKRSRVTLCFWCKHSSYCL